jgi:hypothetical protein
MNKDDNTTKFLCKKCKGKKRFKSGQLFYYDCPECLGKGYLDWIENIIGSRNSFIESFHNEIVSQMAQQMAEQIDRDILKSFGVSKEIIDDNGIVSEFLLLNSFEQKESSKKDKSIV